jgi:hypothetical protein
MRAAPGGFAALLPPSLISCMRSPLSQSGLVARSIDGRSVAIAEELGRHTLNNLMWADCERASRSAPTVRKLPVGKMGKSGCSKSIRSNVRFPPESDIYPVSDSDPTRTFRLPVGARLATAPSYRLEVCLRIQRHAHHRLFAAAFLQGCAWPLQKDNNHLIPSRTCPHRLIEALVDLRLANNAGEAR